MIHSPLINKNKDLLITVGIALLFIIAGFQNLIEYVRPELNVILCLMIAPLVLRVKKPGEYSNRYAWISMLLLLMFHLLHVQVLFLGGIVLAIFFLIESRYGKIGWLPLVLMVLLSPMLQYMIKTFTFSIRLELSEISAMILTKIGKDVTVNGNIFTTDGISFAVDQACMGLNTFTTGLIMTTILVAIAENKTNQSTRFIKLCLTYGLAGALLIIANLSRIILLVLFKSMPETLSHELIGITCLLAYVALPMYLVTNKLNLNKSSQSRLIRREKTTSPLPKLALIIPIVIIIFGLNLNREFYKKDPQNPQLAALELPGMTKEVLATGVIKYQDEKSLVYIKPATKFWRADHTPAICWKASGYSFEQINKMTIGEHNIYTAMLEKEKDYLYTAWWYDNGYVKTNSQTDWRIRNINGEQPFNLINVTAANPDMLLRLCEEYLQKDLLSIKNIQPNHSTFSVN